MKKVCIVTVYNSENAGSYFQAYALKETLGKLGYEVSFCRRPSNGTSHDVKEAVVTAIKCVLNGRLRRGISRLKRHRLYSVAQKKFNIVRNAEPDIDMLVYGSDTLWNFEDSYFYRKSKHYLGLDSPGKRKITYAISAGNTERELFASIPDIGNALESFEALGVRDSHTGEMISSLTSNKITYVCDPTFLLDAGSYGAFKTNEIKDRYLLIYYFGTVDAPLKEWIIEYSARHKLKIFGLGLIGDTDWYESVITSPSSFITYFAQADFIVTNTFHGSAFSIIFNRQFIACTKDKQKVIELLNEYNLNDRVCHNAGEAEEASRRAIDYTDINAKVENKKVHSIEFLKEHLVD